MQLSLLAASLGCIAQAIAFPNAFNELTPRSPSPKHIQNNLGPQLSKNASIYFPGSAQFADGASRWSTYDSPNISVVVEVANADDVSKTIRYANSVNMPFLAVSRGHGYANTLGKLKHGIEIWLTQLDTIEVAADGNSALIGGGVYIKQVIDALTPHKKVAASGACGCVGLMGAGLGGGHGRLQGYYGLVSDNFIELHVVLWNGTQITVSNTSHSDLFWGMQGAGHNYGVVTSLTYKIYDQPAPSWFYAIYIYTQDKLEAVFNELIKQSAATLPKEMGYVYVNYAWDTNVSTTEPIIALTLNYAGTAAAAAQYANPFKSIGPVSATEGNVPYSQIAEVSSTDVDDAVCQRGREYNLHAADLVVYNTTANRAIYNLFRDTTVKYPVYQNSIVMMESYSQQGVKAVNPATTAYADRQNNIIFTLVSIYDTNATLDAKANSWGDQTRKLIHEGQGGANLTVYVNYAHGEETLESVYGYEPWRLARLRGLKKAYDPQNKFGWYMPIV